eukprot:TRINITY_DN11286_c0_g1_i1.p1 TRINITY_DN11286_c0_g1~~TRINITY_DN11286_c0_g1_i1.p1  ORF type:complete len:546 (+),score=138.47 TRINITY_DN11286_c0_g1_i1:105-1742(+)
MLVQVGKRYVSEQRDIDPSFAKGMKDLLSKSKVFQDCHDEFIVDLIVSSNRKEYAPNRYLMEEGGRGESMFVLFRGVVEVTSNGRYVCKLRDGSIVGEAALLNIDNRRTASVRSVQKCDVAIIFRSTFHSILEKYPWEKKKFQREMKGKLMELGKLIDVKDDMNLEQQANQCDALKRVPFFASDDSLHDFVAELAMNASSYWYRPGRVIIQEGDTRCDEMYVLLSGAVEMSACGEFLGRLENDLFGEICVLDLLERRTANVVAATECNCMVFSRQVVIPILAKYPDARMRLLEHARQRLMALNDAIGASSGEGGRSGTKTRDPSFLNACAIGYGPALQGADAHMFASNKVFQTANVDLLREISLRMTSQKVNEGVTIMEESTTFRADRDFVYWIAKGKAEVWKKGLFIRLLKDGEVFGELDAYIGAEAREVTVKAASKMVLRLIRASVLKEVLETYEDPGLTVRWEEQMDERLEKLSQKTSLLKQHDYLTQDLDMLFLKLPTKTRGAGQRMPKTAPLGPALAELGKLTNFSATQRAALTGIMSAR